MLSALARLLLTIDDAETTTTTFTTDGRDTTVDEVCGCGWCSDGVVCVVSLV